MLVASSASSMSRGVKPALDGVRRVLAERSFSDIQVNRLIPKLHEEHKRKPKLLAEIIDCWNETMGQAVVPLDMEHLVSERRRTDCIPAIASPPSDSPVARKKVNMASILAEVEPDLLKLCPESLRQRHRHLDGLGIFNNTSDYWLGLLNAPRGLYLQDWLDLTKKILYIEQKVVDLLYDKREQRGIKTHPIVSHISVIERDFDHIRTRFLFAERTGFSALSHMRKIQTALDRPTLGDLLLADDGSYLAAFAPFCSAEELRCFSNLIKNHEIDEDDAELYSSMAELDSLRHKPNSFSIQRHGGSRQGRG